MTIERYLLSYSLRRVYSETKGFVAAGSSEDTDHKTGHL